MALTASDGASAAASAVQAQVDAQINEQPIKSNADMAKDIAAAYHSYAQQAVLPGADMTAGGTIALLETAFIVDNTPAISANIASGLCSYWSSFVTPGEPANGGTSVVSVVVNGAAMLAAMTVAVNALVTTSAVADPWLKFFQDTEAIVKTIPCIIVEIIPGTPPVPTPFPGLIS